MMAIRYENKTLINFLNTTVDILFTFAVTLCVSYGQTTTFEPPLNGNNIRVTTRLPNTDFSSNRCLALHSCKSSVPFPERRCQCDSLCDVMEDCCHDVDQSFFLTSHDIPKHFQFQCTLVKLNIKEQRLLLVTKCASIWADDKIRSLCEDIVDKDDFLVDIPVTATDNNHVTYRNRYCAYCNHQYSFVSWNYTLHCFTPPTQESDFSNCDASLIEPDGVNTRICLPELVSTCSTDHENKEDVHKCLYGNYAHVRLAHDLIYFRNLYCALCNGIPFENIICSEFYRYIDVFAIPNSNFRCLVDINKASIDCSGDTVGRDTNCKESEIYDFKSMKCRPIICPYGMESLHGVCMKAENISGLGPDIGLSLGARNCTWSKLEA